MWIGRKGVERFYNYILLIYRNQLRFIGGMYEVLYTFTNFEQILDVAEQILDVALADNDNYFTTTQLLSNLRQLRLCFFLLRLTS